MSYSESIIRLRSRVHDAVVKGLIQNNGKEFLEATLIQIMNDAEKNRQNCLTQAENLRRQASVFDGQAAAFGSVTSIVFNVINGYVTVAEKDEAERAAQEIEKKNSSPADESAVKTEELVKKGRKKRA